MALVCKMNGNADDSSAIERALNEKCIPYDSICEVRVPSRHPLTRKQYETWNSVWPLVFHESMDEKYYEIINF